MRLFSEEASTIARLALRRPLTGLDGNDDMENFPKEGSIIQARQAVLFFPFRSHLPWSKYGRVQTIYGCSVLTKGIKYCVPRLTMSDILSSAVYFAFPFAVFRFLLSIVHYPLSVSGSLGVQ